MRRGGAKRPRIETGRGDEGREKADGSAAALAAAARAWRSARRRRRTRRTPGPRTSCCGATRSARAATMKSTTPELLDIGQTRHGVQADGRTPTCTSCHGESKDHINEPEGAKERPKPGRHSSAARAQSRGERAERSLPHLPRKGTARTCGRKQRTRCRNDLSCTNCHTIHSAARQGARQGDAARSLLRLPQGPARRGAPHLAPPGRRGQDRLLRLPQPAWLGRAEAAGGQHGQRDLLDLPRREARPVPVRAPVGERRLHELPHAAWLDQCAAAAGRARRTCARNATRATTPHPGNVYSANMLPGGAIANANVAPDDQRQPGHGCACHAGTTPAAQLPFRACANCHSRCTAPTIRRASTCCAK